MTLKSALKVATESLETTTPQLDAEVLLAFVLNQNRTWILTHLDDELSKKELKEYQNLLRERKEHKPIAYLTNKKAFYGREFYVNEDVLVPRPESELFLELLQKHYARTKDFTLADIGTGSGILAITAALEFPNAKIFATDLSKKALAVAKKNAELLEAPRITFLYSDLLTVFSQQQTKVDVLFANLPYLTEEDLHDSPTAEDLSFEPKQALVAADHGLALMKSCTEQAIDVLEPNGRLYLEMMPYQIPQFVQWVEQMNLPYFLCVEKDLGGLDRIVVLQLVQR